MGMTKDQIAHEIRRTADENGGVPLGERRLKSETGIKKSDWQAYWARLSDAHAELGLGRNELSKAYRPTELLAKYAALAQSLGRLPSENDLAFKAKNDQAFPSAGVFRVRLGYKDELVRKLAEHCADHAELKGVLHLCEQHKPRRREPGPGGPGRGTLVVGSVYMLKVGRMYKIGKATDFGRRERQLSIQLPQKPNTVHVIRTDDPVGIEEYWHKRFAAKRQGGEWFELSAEDVAAFKRRKFM